MDASEAPPPPGSSRSNRSTDAAAAGAATLSAERQGPLAEPPAKAAGRPEEAEGAEEAGTAVPEDAAGAASAAAHLPGGDGVLRQAASPSATSPGGCPADASPGDGSTSRGVLSTIYTKWNLCEQAGSLNDLAIGELQAATFEDRRWDRALAHLAASGVWNEPEVLADLVRRGAKLFGFWHLPEAALQVLTSHLRGEAGCTTPALAERLRRLPEAVAVAREMATSPTSFRQRTPKWLARGATAAVGEAGGRARPRAWGEGVELVRAKLMVFSVVFLLCNLSALAGSLVMYPGIVDILGFPIYIARAGGAGTLLWTALLLLSMSRTFLKTLGRCLPIRSCLLELLDQHKELHIFCGQAMFATAALHVLGHCVGTVPGILSHSLDEVNAILGCANPDTTPLYIGGSIEWLQLTKCPLEEKPTYLSAIYGTTPGLSGVALVAVSALIGYTANAARRRTRFECFIYLHQAAVPLWLVLLFIHGSAGWVGIGFPLVVFVCSLPAALYLLDRVLRLVRYYFFTGKAVHVVDVVIRPGAGRRARGSLINLKLTKPQHLWSFREGMYAFICMPEYSSFQWHPFTICSGKDEETVDFIINACGDWTDALAARCLAAHKGEGELPTLALDGPFLAPTATALSHELLVAVGAGVGITPFLSLMSTIIAVLGWEQQAGGSLPLKEAHFFWMTRSADELLFGRRQFTRIAADPALRGKVFLHLHVTQREPAQDVCGYLFREAVRRQSRADRAAYQAAVVSEASASAGRGLQLPCCWAHGVKQDVLWVDALLEADDGGATAAQLAAAHEDHWAEGVAARQERSSNSGEGAHMGRTARGLFAATISLSSCVMTLQDSRASRAGAGAGSTATAVALPSPAGAAGAVALPGQLPCELAAAVEDAPRDQPDQPAGEPDVHRQGGAAAGEHRDSGGYGNYLPVVFGRPDFAAEIGAIGKAHRDLDVNVFACGNDALVQSLKDVCSNCSRASKALVSGSKLRAQEFVLHYERFG